MVLDENNNMVSQNGRAVMSNGGQIHIPVFPVDCEEPFNVSIRNNILTLLHGGYCLMADGHYGPHLRCTDECPFSDESCFKAFSQHLPTCGRESCTFPNCKDSLDLLSHFIECQAEDCRRCQAPVFSLMNELVEDLIRNGRYDEVDEVQAEEFPLWKTAFIQVTLRKWT